MARIVLATFGSLGDLHPVVALALRLASRGHEAVVAASAEHAARIEGAGLAFAPLGPDQGGFAADAAMTPADAMRRMMGSDDWLLREAILPRVRAALPSAQAAMEGADLAVLSPLALGARLAAERRGVPYATVGLQPLVFPSVHDPPVLGSRPVASRLARRMPPAVVRALLGVELARVTRWLRPYAALRRELGLPPEPALAFLPGAHAAAHVGLYSPLMGGVRPDHPPGLVVAGFAFHDSEPGGGPSLPPALDDFLAAGPPPVVFTLGSTAVEIGGRFYDESPAAARAAGLRAVLLAGAERAGRPAGAQDVFVAGYVPHSALLPRAAAVVHHGGIGTSAQALRAGVPQLVVPFFADQHDNAARLGRLGVARSLRRGRYDAARAAGRLRALAGGAHAGAVARAADRIAGEDGAGAAVAVIERVLAAGR